MNQNNLKIKGNWNNEHLMTYSHIVTKNACQWLLQNTVKKKQPSTKYLSVLLLSVVLGISFPRISVSSISCSWHHFLLAPASLAISFSWHLLFMPLFSLWHLLLFSQHVSRLASLSRLYSAYLCSSLSITGWQQTPLWILMESYGLIYHPFHSVFHNKKSMPSHPRAFRPVDIICSNFWSSRKEPLHVGSIFECRPKWSPSGDWLSV